MKKLRRASQEWQPSWKNFDLQHFPSPRAPFTRTATAITRAFQPFAEAGPLRRDAELPNSRQSKHTVW
jgi:hypothetical protein